MYLKNVFKEPFKTSYFSKLLMKFVISYNLLLNLYVSLHHNHNFVKIIATKLSVILTNIYQQIKLLCQQEQSILYAIKEQLPISFKYLNLPITTLKSNAGNAGVLQSLCNESLLLGIEYIIYLRVLFRGLQLTWKFLFPLF